jgi:hypothetical protein
LKRRVLRLGAVIGAVTVSALAVSPVFAAAPLSQATAQSIDLSLAGNSLVKQQITATSDGTGPVDKSTIPPLVGLLPNNNTAFVGVAPQEATAKVIQGAGISFACAGVAGTGGGLVKVGNKACDITRGSKAITLDLANVDLGGVLLGDGAITSAISGIPGIDAVLTPLGLNTTSLALQLTNTLKLPVALPLTTSVIEGACTANPATASGSANLVDASLDATIAGNTVNLLNLPANPPPGTHLTDLNAVTTTLTTALQTNFSTALNKALTDINPALAAIQGSLLTPLSNGLTPVTDAIRQYLADIVFNEQVTSEGGKKIDVTALHATVLPNSAIPGGSLLEGRIGHVSCGPNRTTSAEAGSPHTCAKLPCGNLPDIPTVVDSGLAGHADHTARNVLGATAALLLLAGTAGLAGYRRMLNK